jgi:hypothetical protein
MVHLSIERPEFQRAGRQVLLRNGARVLEQTASCAEHLTAKGYLK